MPELINTVKVLEPTLKITNGDECQDLRWLSDLSSSSGGRMVETCIEASDPSMLNDHLFAMSARYSNDASWTSWQSFHISHARAAGQLAEFAAE